MKIEINYNDDGMNVVMEKGGLEPQKIVHMMAIGMCSLVDRMSDDREKGLDGLIEIIEGIKSRDPIETEDN